MKSFNTLLVTFDKDFDEDSIKQLKSLLYQIKGVCGVEAYIPSTTDIIQGRVERIKIKTKILDELGKLYTKILDLEY